MTNGRRPRCTRLARLPLHRLVRSLLARRDVADLGAQQASSSAFAVGRAGGVPFATSTQRMPSRAATAAVARA